MTKKHIITIAGMPGSGKSTTAKAVAKQLEFRHFSSGDLFRSIAKEKGVDVLQANLNAEKNAEIDYLVDARLREIGDTDDEIVVDSRTAWHWIPQSFKVFLDVDLLLAAKRILHGMDIARLASEHVSLDPDEYAHILQSRLDSENRRYKALYKIDPNDKDNYDLVIDTAVISEDQVINMVIDGFQGWVNQKDAK